MQTFCANIRNKVSSRFKLLFCFVLMMAVKTVIFVRLSFNVFYTFSICVQLILSLFGRWIDIKRHRYPGLHCDQHLRIEEMADQHSTDSMRVSLCVMFFFIISTIKLN